MQLCLSPLTSYGLIIIMSYNYYDAEDCVRAVNGMIKDWPCEWTGGVAMCQPSPQAFANIRLNDYKATSIPAGLPEVELAALIGLYKEIDCIVTAYLCAFM